MRLAALPLQGASALAGADRAAGGQQCCPKPLLYSPCRTLVLSAV
jgi:hypothetical protein